MGNLVRLVILSTLAGCTYEPVGVGRTIDAGRAAVDTAGDRERGGVDLSPTGPDTSDAERDSRSGVAEARAHEAGQDLPDAIPVALDAFDAARDAHPDLGRDTSGDVSCQTDKDCTGPLVCVLGACVRLASSDSGPDVGVATQDSVPDLTKTDTGTSDVGRDLPKPCSGCEDPGLACPKCYNEPPDLNPTALVFVQCIRGKPYDCNGQPLPVESADACLAHPSDSWFCVPCTRYKGFQLQCPSPAPYCNVTTGACAAAP